MIPNQYERLQQMDRATLILLRILFAFSILKEVDAVKYFSDQRNLFVHRVLVKRREVYLRDS